MGEIEIMLDQSRSDERPFPTKKKPPLPGKDPQSATVSRFRDKVNERMQKKVQAYA